MPALPPRVEGRFCDKPGPAGKGNMREPGANKIAECEEKGDGYDEEG